MCSTSTLIFPIVDGRAFFQPHDLLYFSTIEVHLVLNFVSIFHLSAEERNRLISDQILLTTPKVVDNTKIRTKDVIVVTEILYTYGE